MPELPEVTTVARQLNAELPLTIKMQGQSPFIQSFFGKNKIPALQNKILIKVERIGKFLHFEFADGHHLISHLGMSGGWRISKTPLELKHQHLTLFAQGEQGQVILAYVDPRRFGKMKWLDADHWKKSELSKTLDMAGPDFNVAYLKNVFQHYPGKMLKPFLLDQKNFPGCGNYMASEMCARAGVMPDRKCGEISSKEMRKLIEATKVVIEGNTKTNGLSFSGGYFDANGEKGEGLEHLVVFHQKICKLCHKTPTVKTNLGGRGTYHCPRCQA